MPLLNRFDYTFDFLGKRQWALILSSLLLLLSIGALAIRGLNLGLDFTGGTSVIVNYSTPVALDVVRENLRENGFPEATVKYFGTTHDVSIYLGTQKITPNTMSTPTTTSTPTTVNVPKSLTLDIDRPIDKSAPRTEAQALLSSKILDVLQTKGNTVIIQKVEFVGPTVGDELIEKGGLAILLTLFGVLIYVALRFEYRFALGAIAALIHDTLITVGLFSIFALEFDLVVLAAILAVIGYSLNDTIVVFDRVRDNFLKMRKRTPVEVVNASINQMLGRTVMTSITTALVLVVLFFMGGELLHGFSTALLIGILIGTYSSIYIASTTALALNISKADLMPVEKEGLKP